MMLIESFVAYPCVFPPFQRQRHACYNTHSGPPLDCGAYHLLRPEKLWQMYAPCPFVFLARAGTYPSPQRCCAATLRVGGDERRSLATTSWLLHRSTVLLDQSLVREGVWPIRVQAA